MTGANSDFSGNSCEVGICTPWVNLFDLKAKIGFQKVLGELFTEGLVPVNLKWTRPRFWLLPRQSLEVSSRPVTARCTPRGVSRCRARVSTMAGASTDVVPGLEPYVAVLLSYIITRRRRAAAHRARLDPPPSARFVRRHGTRIFAMPGRG